MSDSSGEIDNSSKQDLWSFIKNSKATESASFKVLRKFILSLNKNELKHLIETYLKSKLSKRKHDNTVSYTQTTANRLLNANNKHSTLNTIDKQILSKLNRKYGKKYNKKVVKKMQQNHANKPNKTLLSIHPQVLAYSFQYLSYSELCKIQHTCIYFTYLNKKYPALTHYYLLLDRKLFVSVVKNKINLNSLSNYKHINIDYLYHDSDEWLSNTKNVHSKLFKYVLKTVISQSISNLHTLQITPSYRYYISNYVVRKAAPFNLLLYVMNEFPCLPITNLIWKRDIFIPSISQNVSVQQMIRQIQEKIITHFPQLKHFQFGPGIAFPGFRAPATFDIPPMIILSKSIIVHVINNYNELQSLTLNCPRWNVLANRHNLIPLIAANMKHLKTFSVTTLVTKPAFCDGVHRCLSVQELTVSLQEPTGEISEDCATYSQQILARLFLCFIGIKKFTFDGDSIHDSPIIEWGAIFRILLLQKKSIYYMHSGSMFLLQSLAFKRMSYMNSINILKALTNLKDEICFDLKNFDIQTRFGWTSDWIPPLFAEFVNDHFIPFIKSVEDNFKLRTINVSFDECGNQYIDIQHGYFEPVLKLLYNIPKSVTSFKLSIPPQFRTGSTETRKIKEIESTKLAQKLSLILAEKTDETKLELIALGNVDLSLKAKDFLRFYFGFNNKLIIADNKYYFKFV